MPRSTEGASTSAGVTALEPHAERVPESFRVIALIAAYNEEDIIAAAIEHLLRQGVLVYLIDHCSTDRTVEQAAKFLNQGLLRIERFPEESGFSKADRAVYRWEHLLQRKEQLAQTLEADWFLHHDADELRESPWANLRLREALHLVQVLGFNAVDFEVLNFRPTRDGFQMGDDPAATFSWFEPPAGVDRVQIKGWRGGVPIDLATTGGHDARFEGRRVYPLRFLMRHYPLRSQAQATRKVFRDRRPRLHPEELRRNWHIQYDEVKTGESFIRDLSGLTAFEPNRVRAELQVRNRDLEALEQQLATERARAFAGPPSEPAFAAEQRVRADDLAWYQREWAARERALVAAQGEVAALRSDAIERGRQLELFRQALARANEAMARLSEEKRALLESWSWRLTAPARRVLGRLRGF